MECDEGILQWMAPLIFFPLWKASLFPLLLLNFTSNFHP